MEFDKIFKRGHVRVHDTFSFNGIESFELRDDRLIAFIPNDFSQTLDPSNVIRHCAFSWTDNIPMFRFKVEIESLDDDFLDKYEEYISSIKVNRTQKKFHLYPDFLLKSWKQSKPKIFDAKNKNILNYREDFFMQDANPNPTLLFIEEFSKPIEHELSLILKGKKDVPRFIQYIPLLFASRQQVSNEFETLNLKNRKERRKAKDYKGVKANRDLTWLPNAADQITRSSHVASNTLTGSPSLMHLIKLKENLPLGQIHYFSSWYEGHQIWVFPLSPSILMVMYEIELENKVKDQGDNFFNNIIDLYIANTLLDKRNRFYLINDDTDTEMKKLITEKEFVSYHITALIE